MKRFLQFFVFCVFFACVALAQATDYTLSIATIIRNEGPYLQEWIEYHRMVGVDHFLIYNDKSTDHWDKVLLPYISEGLVEVIDWPVPSKLFFVNYKCRALRDALHRTKGVSEWIAFIDPDEYLLPTEEATVTECLKNHFSEAGGVFLNFHHFGTNGTTLDMGESLLFHLTACAKKDHPTNCMGHSIVRPDQTNAEAITNPFHFVLTPSSQYCNGDGLPIYFPEKDDLPLYVSEKNGDTHGEVHTRFMRINHYHMRDESFFLNVRLPSVRTMGMDESELWEKYHAFNQEQDRAIIDFILKHHPNMYEKYWKQRSILQNQPEFTSYKAK